MNPHVKKKMSSEKQVLLPIVNMNMHYYSFDWNVPQKPLTIFYRNSTGICTGTSKNKINKTVNINDKTYVNNGFV